MNHFCIWSNYITIIYNGPHRLGDMNGPKEHVTRIGAHIRLVNYNFNLFSIIFAKFGHSKPK